MRAIEFIAGCFAKSNDPRAIIVMDDCLADKGSWAKDPQVSDLLYNGRHRKITYILTMKRLDF